MVLVCFNKFFTLHKHATAAAARIKYTAFIRFKHFHQQFYHTCGCIELPAFLAFCQSKLTQEIFIHFA